MSIKNPDQLCINCMREKPNNGVCPFCGFDEAQYEPSPHHLPPRSFLGGMCLIGRVLGEGGFGITYMGWDLNLDLKLAIKEYYPTGYVTRMSSSTNTVMPYRGEKTEFFTTGRSRFINEAKTLAKFYTLPGIVSVRDFFLENGTAYIVMEFVEGETLKQRLSRVGGKIAPSEVFELVRPLLRSLAEMHAAGLIHRDISPDNIMVTPEGNVKLIDFGAARDYLDSGNRSLSVMLKPGYAPEEQYFARGEQGPWTDIYALCATIYRAITGVTPPESVERLRHDQMQAPSALGVALLPAQEAALLRGLAVAHEERWQTIPALVGVLYGTDSSNVNTKKPEQVKKPDNQSTQTEVVPNTKPNWFQAQKERIIAFSKTFSSPKRMIPAGIALVMTLALLISLLAGKAPAETSGYVNPDSTTPSESPAWVPPEAWGTEEEDGAPDYAEEEDGAPDYGEDEDSLNGQHLDASFSVFPLQRPERLPAAEQEALFLKATEYMDLGYTEEAMATYNFARRMDAAYSVASVLDNDGNIIGYSRAASNEKQGSCVAIDHSGAIALYSDGTVSYFGTMLKWKDIVSISGNNDFVLGLKENGTVVATANPDSSNYVVFLDESEGWSDIVAITSSERYEVGLISDGTVVAAGVAGFDPNTVSDWTDIVAIEAGYNFIAGLRSDGTLVTTKPEKYPVSDWENVVAISASDFSIAALTSSGEILYLNAYDGDYDMYSLLSGWQDVVAISNAEAEMIGLRSDGTILTTRADDESTFSIINGMHMW